MDSSIRSTLWGAFAVLVVLIAAGLALTMGILHVANSGRSTASSKAPRRCSTTSTR